MASKRKYDSGAQRRKEKRKHMANEEQGRQTLFALGWLKSK